MTFFKFYPLSSQFPKIHLKEYNDTFMLWSIIKKWVWGSSSRVNVPLSHQICNFLSLRGANCPNSCQRLIKLKTKEYILTRHDKSLWKLLKTLKNNYYWQPESGIWKPHMRHSKDDTPEKHVTNPLFSETGHRSLLKLCVPTSMARRLNYSLIRVREEGFVSFFSQEVQR